MRPIGEDDTKCRRCLHLGSKFLTFLFSHVGLVSLVVGYCLIGGIAFEKLEVEHEKEVKRNMAKVRHKVTQELWHLMQESEVLHREEWSGNATEKLAKFELELIDAMRKKGWDGDENVDNVQWTFHGALFYSIVVITTIGYGHIAPKTPWGKIVTIIYAILGIPLMLLCLSNIGDAMAHSFRFFYWKICCYFCTRKPRRRSRRSRTRSSNRYPSASGRARTASFRRSQRHSQRSADSAVSDSAISRSSSDPDNKYIEEADWSGTSGLGNSKRSSQRSKTPDAAPMRSSSDAAKVPVISNKYVVNPDELRLPLQPPGGGGSAGTLTRQQSSSAGQVQPIAHRHSYPHRKRGQGPGGRDPESVGGGPRGGSDSVSVSAPQTPISARGRFNYRDKELLDREGDAGDEYPEYPEVIDDVEDEDDEEGEHEKNRPVPIWLCVFLVLAYILGGAWLFVTWEKWDYLDSAYFCFITLTTIGFGDLVPARKGADTEEMSIAFCSLYLLFGIALLAMSFNLVQEEVISSVKGIARRLGIIKSEGGGGDDEED